MAAIDIRRKHGRSLKDARAAVERIAEAIGEEYGIKHVWKGNELHFSRSGVDGRISVARHDVHIHAELGWLVGALKGAIEHEIERQLDQEFGAA
jgi:putative polyhydroxyalkanoate system protein